MLQLTKFSAFLFACLLLLGGFLWLLIPTSLALQLNEENGFIEILASCFLVSAGFSSLYLFLKNRLYGWDVYSFFMFAAFARELDWHKDFTSMSVFKSRFYLSPDVPITEKFIGGIVICTLLIATYFVVQKLKLLWRLFLDKNLTVTLGFTACFLILLGKILDGFFRYFPSLKELRPVYGDHLRLFEEGLEMVAAGLFFLIPILIGRFFKRQP